MSAVKRRCHHHLWRSSFEPKKLRPVSPDYKHLSTSPIYQPNLQQRHPRKSTVCGFSFSIWPRKKPNERVYAPWHIIILLASVSRSENCIFVKPGTFPFPIPCCFMMVISKTTTKHNFQVVECQKSFCQILILKFQKDFHRIGWSRMVKFLCNYSELKQLQTERVMAACYHFPFPKMHQNTRLSSNIYETWHCKQIWRTTIRRLSKHVELPET